ncbi:type II toxin-antitoxin system PemK/MazF family toxin, partial [Acinetobacter baumannii]|uniref:type II toxin-antitoxin system PemK/MazF family toxin n=1 Tax=Acinetobacter baumannii TaxID=470 RepID=UPI000AD53229
EGIEKKKKLPMFVELIPSTQNGQTKHGVIECGQIRVLDKKKRLKDYIGTVEENIMDKVDAALNTVMA